SWCPCCSAGPPSSAGGHPRTGLSLGYAALRRAPASLRLASGWRGFRGITECSYRPVRANLAQLSRHLRVLLPLLLRAPSRDELVARLARLARAAFRLAPRADRVTAARGLALAAAHRVVNRVHRDSAHAGPAALPAAPAGLAELDVALLGVADLADGRPASRVNQPDLP